MVQPSQSPQLLLDIAPDSQRVERGGEAVFLITIENRGREAQAQSLEVTGLPEAWVQLEFDARRRVFPSERRTASLLVKVPREASASNLPFTVFARAGSDQSSVACALEVFVPGQPSSQPVIPTPPPVAVPPGVTLSPQRVEWRGAAQGAETIMLTLRNTGADDRSYTLALEGLPAGWYTLEDRVSVPARQAREVPIVVTPPAQARQADYSLQVTATALDDALVRATASSTFVVAAPAQRQAPPRPVSPIVTDGAPEPEREGPPAMPPGVRLGPRSRFEFGQAEVAVQATITITNPSPLIETYRIMVRGIDEAWYQLDTPEVALQPGASLPVPLRLTPRSHGGAIPAGDYSFRVRVAPLKYPDAVAEASGTLSIAGVPIIDAKLTPPQVTGRKEKFKLTIQNKGGVPFSPWVEAGDPQGMCHFAFDPPGNVEVGEEIVVPVWVGAARQGLVGTRQTYDFQLRVSPAGGGATSARTFNARFVHQPFLGPRTLLWCLFVAFFAAIAGMFLVLGPSSVDRAALALECGYDDDYVDSAGVLLVRTKCGGAPEPLQKGASTLTGDTTGSTGGSTGVTPEPPTEVTPLTPVVTVAPGTCAGDPGLGLAVDQQVRLRADAIVRDAPAGADTGRRGGDLAGVIRSGPECAGNLVWWEVETAEGTGWTAEQTENNLPLILQP